MSPHHMLTQSISPTGLEQIFLLPSLTGLLSARMRKLLCQSAAFASFTRSLFSSAERVDTDLLARNALRSFTDIRSTSLLQAHGKRLGEGHMTLIGSTKPSKGLSW